MMDADATEADSATAVSEVVHVDATLADSAIAVSEVGHGETWLRNQVLPSWSVE